MRVAVSLLYIAAIRFVRPSGLILAVILRTKRQPPQPTSPNMQAHKPFDEDLFDWGPRVDTFFAATIKRWQDLQSGALQPSPSQTPRREPPVMPSGRLSRLLPSLGRRHSKRVDDK
jgi:hypothetical protein